MKAPAYERNLEEIFTPIYEQMFWMRTVNFPKSAPNPLELHGIM